MSLLDNMTDEIESILFIAREVMGGYTGGTYPCRADDSLPSPPTDFGFGLQSFRLERGELRMEGTAESA